MKTRTFGIESAKELMNLESGIKLRALDRAIKSERLSQQRSSQGLDELLSFNQLFSTNKYIADPRGMEIRNYLTNKENAFIPANLQYHLNKKIQYADIDQYME